MKKLTLSTLFFCLFPALPAYSQNLQQLDTAQTFIGQMVQKHQFSKPELEQLFSQIDTKEQIIKTISSPAEALPWPRYKAIFLTDSRIDNGVKFWRENEKLLAAVEQQYGVPAEILIAIIGVETAYGQHTGKYRVIDALSTLAFLYPPRSAFFSAELEKFLLLCRSEKINPLAPTGSYAGAMGMPQFMPSSFLAYAADYDHDNRKDIWLNTGDVIASVANYFVKHGWQKGQPVAAPLIAQGEQYKKLLNNDLKQNLRLAELKSVNVTLKKGSKFLNGNIKLLAFEHDQSTELWAGFTNFYVITRYNHSPLYAMAVFQLSQAILNKHT
ncbi:MAG: lytic murein transglycosylase B [Methylococcaceae bacterium]|jgi:membrane-bound lytic murein transglycosylase B